MNFLKAMRIAFFFYWCVGAPSVFGAQIYSFLQEGCQRDSGLIINVDHESLDLIDLEGNHNRLDRSSIQAILIYKTLHNPIEQIDLNANSLRFLKSVYREDSKTLSFQGWPVRFVEELVEFYDITGESHVIEQESILKMHRPQQLPMDLPPSQDFEAIELGTGNMAFACPGLQKPNDGRNQPLRIISDKINIREFFANFERGYEDLNGYEDRIDFYSKPILFDQKMRLGFHLMQDRQEASIAKQGANLPYFQWGTGRPYHHQAQIRFLNITSPWAPLVESFFGFATEVKFHMFRASFVTNLESIGAGEPYYTQHSGGFKQGDVDEDGEEVERDSSLLAQFPALKGKKPRMVNTFNYITFLGTDWGAYSFGIGSYFPSFGFRTKSVFKEVMGTQMSPIVRLQYTTEAFGLSGLYSMTDYQYKDPLSDKIGVLQQVPISDPTYINNVKGLERDPELPYRSISKYQFQSNFFRGGGHYNFGKDSTVALDLLSITGVYEDWIDSVDQGARFNVEKNYFIFDHKTLSASFKKQLGKYLSTKGLVHFFTRDYQTRTAGVKEEVHANKSTIGGQVEFIF